MSGNTAFPATEAERWTLENGLELIVCEDPDAPLASLQVWCRSGSIHEGKWLGGGLSHLLEHMAFKGTEHREGSEIVRGVQDVGGYFNAYTSFERTVYWVDVPIEGVETALDILCDVASCAALPEEELRTEQDVIRREIEMGKDDPDQSLSRLLFSTAYGTHPYRFPVIGHLDVFDRVTREDLTEFYRGHYPPNNLFIVVAGGVDSGKIRRQVESFYEEQRRGVVAEEVIQPEPRQLGRRESHREFDTQLSRFSLGWHIPGVTHEDVPALDVLSTVLGAGRTSRLYSKLRESEGLAHSVNSYAYTPSQSGLFGVSAVMERENRERVEERVLEIIDEVICESVTTDELAKARNMVLSDQLHVLTTTQGLAADLGSNWMMARNLDFSRDYLADVSAVERKDVQRVASAYLKSDNMTAVSLNPRGSVSKKRGAARSDARRSVRREVLSNGLTVLLREDSRLPLVNLEACFRGGLHAESPGAGGSMRLFAKALVKGSETSDAAELAARLESAGGSLESSSARSAFGLSMDVMSPDTNSALGVLGELLCDPSFPENEVERERDVQMAAIRAADDQPFTIAMRVMRRRRYGDHCYSRDVLGPREELSKIGREALLDLRQRCLVARNGVLAVFGDVKGDEILADLEGRLAKMPGGELFLGDNKAASRGTIAEPGEEVASSEKAQAVVMVGYAACNLFHEDRPALELVDEACSDMSSRLFLRIREEMGSAYSVGSSFGCGFDPGTFVVYASTSPERAEEVRDALIEEVGKVAQDGLGSEELERAKRTFAGKMAMQRQSNGGLAAIMAQEEASGLGWNYGEEHKRIIDGLGLERVNEAARSYLGDESRVVVIVSPGSSD